jgi:hypothetical protein
MNLKDYINSTLFADSFGITEAISSGKYRMKIGGFPRKPDKDAIIEWLDGNGFRKVVIRQGITPGVIEKFTKGENDRIYYTGNYDGVKIHEWISFGTRRHNFMIRTGEANWFDDSMRYRDMKTETLPDRFSDINDFADKVDEIFGD